MAFGMCVYTCMDKSLEMQNRYDHSPAQEVTELAAFLLQKDVAATELSFGRSCKSNAAASC